jgi:hypothetical protein
MPRDTFEEKLELLVEKIADDASKPDVKLADRVDALKALTTYYIGDSKLKKGAGNDDDDGTTVKPFSFANARKNIEAVK